MTTYATKTKEGGESQTLRLLVSLQMVPTQIKFKYLFKYNFYKIKYFLYYAEKIAFASHTEWLCGLSHPRIKVTCIQCSLQNIIILPTFFFLVSSISLFKCISCQLNIFIITLQFPSTVYYCL